MPILSVQSLVADEFAPFGDVLSFDGVAARLVNNGFALRADMAATFRADGGEPVLSIYRARAQALPLALTSLERHPHSSQAFVAMSAPRFLIVVAPADERGSPDALKARAFVGRAGQGINYRPGVWHAPIVALDGDGDFLMFMWERGEADDCIVQDTAMPLQITQD